MKPLVSILIPAYNAQPWIADTIKSAIGQTWPRKEIIVVDDGSRDETLAIAKRFSGDGVKVVSQTNQGAAAARNKAFSVSQGDYIQWLDADDLLAPDKVAKQVEAIGTASSIRTLLSAEWAPFMYRHHKAKFVPTPLWCDLSRVEWLLRKLGQNLHMQTATWLVSRELTEAAGPWNTRLLGDDDGEYFCRVLMASDGIRFVPGAKVYYRVVGTSRLSHIGESDPKKEAQVLSMHLHVEHLRGLEDSDRVRAACLTYLNNWAIHFYPERPDLVQKLEILAQKLGGRVETPRLRWKYVWMEPILGWPAAKRAQLFLPQIKKSFQRRWDKFLFQMDRQSLGVGKHGAGSAERGLPAPCSQLPAPRD